MYQYPDYLMHYGVPGMKWGVRKQRVTSGKANRRSSKSSMSEEDKKARRRRNMKIAAGVAGGVAKKAIKKKVDIYNREIGKASTDTFGQAVKNTATYYKSRKHKRR